MRQARFDLRRIQEATKLDNGFLKVPVFATRSGVFKYTKADGTVVREFRPPSEVFSEDSMESLAGVPFTNRHPLSLVDSKNAKDFMVGFTSDVVEKKGDFVSTSVTITDEKTIREIEDKGLREVSCGYTCDLEFKPGRTDSGEEFDAIQTNIRYNHLAGVDRGRAGPDVRLRMDSNSAVLDENESKPIAKSKPKGDSMAKITLDGAEFEVDAGVASSIRAEIKNVREDAKAKSKDTFGKELKEKEEDAKKKTDELQAKVDALTEEKKKLEEGKLDDKQIHERVAARTALLAVAKKIMPEDTKFDEMSDGEIKKACVEAKCTNLDEEKMKSDVYVEARFDHIREGIESEKADGNKDLKKALGKNAGRTDGGDDVDSEQVRQKNMKADSEAYLKPIGFHLKTA